MKADKLAFERNYPDGSGLKQAVRLNGDTIEIETFNICTFPIEDIDWLIDALQRIKQEITL
jgi:hypothetical protein